MAAAVRPCHKAECGWLVRPERSSRHGHDPAQQSWWGDHCSMQTPGAMSRCSWIRAHGHWGRSQTEFSLVSVCFLCGVGLRWSDRADKGYRSKCFSICFPHKLNSWAARGRNSSIVKIGREENRASHELAQLGRVQSRTEVWLGNFPSELSATLAEDCNFVSH
jgi:hypothetical protein